MFFFYRLEYRRRQSTDSLLGSRTLHNFATLLTVTKTPMKWKSPSWSDLFELGQQYVCSAVVRYHCALFFSNVLSYHRTNFTVFDHTRRMLLVPPFLSCPDNSTGGYGNHSVRGGSSRSLCSVVGPLGRSRGSSSKTPLTGRGSRLHGPGDRREGRHCVRCWRPISLGGGQSWCVSVHICGMLCDTKSTSCVHYIIRNTIWWCTIYIN